MPLIRLLDKNLTAMGAAAQRNQIPGAWQVLRIMSFVWQTHTQPIAVVGLIFILVTCVSLTGFLFLAVSRLTAMDEHTKEINP
jgi:hypothetical protein